MSFNRRKISKDFKDLIMNKDTRSMDEICSSEERGILPQQKFIQEFTRKYPNWNKLLLYHEIGSGKTCTSILVAEDLIQKGKKIKVILPARLKTNYMDELISPCALNKYISNEDYELYNNSNTPLDMKNKIRNKINKKIEEKYEIFSFEKIKSEITGHKVKEWVFNFTKDSLIIVDEVHNMLGGSIGNKYPEIIRKNNNISDINTVVLRLLTLHAHPSCKFIFMTATPVFDNITQFKNLVSILADVNKLDEIQKTNELSELVEFLRGKISYYPGISSNAYPLKEYIEHNIPISKMQNEERYTQLTEPDDEKKEAFYAIERQLLLFSPMDFDYIKNIDNV